MHCFRRVMKFAACEESLECASICAQDAGCLSPSSAHYIKCGQCAESGYGGRYPTFEALADAHASEMQGRCAIGVHDYALRAARENDGSDGVEDSGGSVCTYLFLR